ncbi:MAG TPA: hypothetical protein VNN80_33305 [Polyangiaceae bacterium]|nr:hypothetical protein [Polyangiaceae bacterium]
MIERRLAACALLLAGCKGAAVPVEAPPAAAAPPAIRVKATPPTSKDVIDAALQSHGVPLSVHDSCRNVGTEPTDTTLGRYMSGFIAELDPESGKNGIVTSVNATDGGWVCRLTIQHRAGDDVWSWGVEFEVGKDGVVKPASYRCIGAG